MKEIAVSEHIEKFSQNNYIYVDKTEYIYKLIRTYERVFFSRPRRFGKSLTLNTIGTLFEKGVEPYFKGTWIYDKWDKGTFPVLHLSFLKYSVTDPADFKLSFCQDLREFASRLRLSGYTDSDRPTDLIRSIFQAMPDEMQIVLLIDEYDCQLTANINNPEIYEQFRSLIRELYAVLKGAKQIRFLAVTGVTRLKDVSIFSVGSDIRDLSYDHAYSQMIGFTRDEIKKFYLDYLKLGVAYEKHKEPESVTDAEVEELLDRMAEHYDGYCFDNKCRNKVFSTYSVNRFLQTLNADKEMVFGDYWYEAGGIPSILKNYLESHELNAEKLMTSEISIPYDDFMNPTSLISINENVLMCQTGYLTLKSPLENPRRVKLGLANREVASALSSLLSLRFLTRDIEIYNEDNDNLLELGSVSEIIEFINSLLAAVAYDLYPVNSEAMLRALLQFYLLGQHLDVRVEQHNAKGRSDLLVNLDKRRIVFELKFSPDGKEADKLLEEAVAQLKSKEYGRENLGERELIRLACVFSGAASERRIIAYRQVV